MRNAAKNRRQEPRIARSYRRALATAILASTVFAGAGDVPAQPLPRTDEGAELPAVLDEIRHAIFVDGDPGVLRAARLEGTIEMGGAAVGRVTTITERDPPSMFEVVEISGTRQVVTILADSTWIEDPNGMVRAASGDERLSLLLALELFFHRYLEGPSTAFDVTLAERTLVIRPADGLARTLRIGEDGVPRALVQSQLGVEVTTTFTDWRHVDGVLFPFVTVQSTGDPRFDMIVRTTSIELLDRLPVGTIARPEGGVSDFEIVDASKAGMIPFESVQNLIHVQVIVNNGEPASFLLDTGAGATVIGSEYAKRAGIARRGLMEARGAGGSEAAAFVEVESLRLPGVVLRGQTVVAVPLETIGGVLGLRVDGILGYDFLSRCAVEIDYAQELLAIRPSGEYTPGPESVRLPLRLEANVPRVEGVLEGVHRGSFLLDTGNAQALLLHSPFVEAAELASRGVATGAMITGIAGQERILSAVIDSLALGDAIFRNVPAVLATSESGIGATGEAIGNIGGGLFVEGVLAIDYSEGSLWIDMSEASASSR